MLTGLPAAAHEDLEDQIRALSAEVAKAPAVAGNYARRAELYRLHRDWENALADYSRARELDPSLEAIDIGCAQLELDRDQPAEALAIIDRFLATRPAHGAARLIEARALAATGQRDAAIAAITRAIDCLPAAQPDHYLERASLFASDEQDRPDARAIAGLEQGATRLGDPVTLHARALAIERSHGRFDDALRRIERVRAKHGDLIPWLITRAEILEEAGRKAEAASAWKDASAAIDRLPLRRRSTPAAREWQEKVRAGQSRQDSGSAE